MSRTAFLTGATGFVGGHVARELVKAGCSVTALARPTASRAGLDDLDIDWREGDITDRDSVTAAMPAGVDGVFHVAASTSIWSRQNEMQRRVNVDGTRNVLDAAIAAGAKRLVQRARGYDATVVS